MPNKEGHQSPHASIERVNGTPYIIPLQERSASPQKKNEPQSTGKYVRSSEVVDYRQTRVFRNDKTSGTM